jgi:hypothetical protein
MWMSWNCFEIEGRLGKVMGCEGLLFCGGEERCEFDSLAVVWRFVDLLYPLGVLLKEIVGNSVLRLD